ncbi:ribosome silencing factor [Aquabacterium sp. OR-4]|uniref:ribosome silencing factor n=1 Tax=Aquabacterium sp. OR-4 TaxID=2978127 RepID=UPI0021B46F39|nr:ribosome silencing factor [Aquabacterium sp. OR-4]MDT7835186.1 ribosome silencing factor [Aquabacterium sp. OR-4]
MDIRKLQRAIFDGLEDVKAQDIVVFNTEHLSPLFERVIIASGTSNRQTKALAASVRDAVKTGGMPIVATEGEDNGEWIIVDCGAAVVHVMQPAIREYYRLEEIWGGKPVKMKTGGPAKGLVKASEPDDEPEEAPATKRAPAKKSAAKKAVAARPAAAPAKKAPARKTAAGSATPASKKAAAQRAINRTPAEQTVVVKRPGAKKVAAKTTASRPAAPPARKAAKPRG